MHSYEKGELENLNQYESNYVDFTIYLDPFPLFQQRSKYYSTSIDIAPTPTNWNNQPI
jgi:hypothetical protein